MADISKYSKEIQEHIYDSYFSFTQSELVELCIYLEPQDRLDQLAQIYNEESL